VLRNMQWIDLAGDAPLFNPGTQLRAPKLPQLSASIEVRGRGFAKVLCALEGDVGLGREDVASSGAQASSTYSLDSGDFQRPSGMCRPCIVNESLPVKYYTNAYVIDSDISACICLGN